ncbi:MAG: hypothetical protein RID91_19075 [Azospirillaceae bacterium]
MTAAMKIEETGGQQAPILAFASDAETIDQIGRIVPGGRRGADIYEGGPREAMAALGEGVQPAVVIVDISGATAPVEDVAGLTAVCGPMTAIIVVGTDNDIGLYRGLIGAGASDYLIKPLDTQELRRAILAAHSEEKQNEPARRGEVIAVVGARGGVGSTSVAIGAAWSIADSYGKQAALIDFDLHFGTAALSLDLEPGSGMRNALEHPDRIDSLFIASAMVAYSDRLSVLGGEEPLDEPIDLKPEGLRRLVDEVCDISDFVICDIPRHLVPSAADVLAVAKTMILVTDLSLSGLRDAMRLKTSLQRMAPQVPLKVVANRVGHAKGVELSKAEFEKSLGATIDCVLPEDPKAGKAALNGKPLTSGGGSKAADALAGLVRAVAGPEEKKAGGLAKFLKWKK